MPTSNMQRVAHRTLLPGVLAVLLVCTATAPSHAESIRSQQWHLTAMKAEEMWKITKGEGVTVAVIDSGVDDQNPDLRGRVLEGKDFAPATKGDQHTDYRGHGTGMAGLIAGTGESGGGDGAFGLAPGAKILPIRVHENASAFPKAIRYAADAGAKVINISMGSEVETPGGPWQAESDAVKYALDKGALIFAAVGNNGDSSLSYPAATPGIVGIGAIGQDLRKTSASQYGPQVDLAAPGIDMVHACGGKTELCKSSGTSDATALASASAALIWSKHPDWTNNQVLRVMLNTAAGPTSGAKRNDYIGYGVVRPRIALKTPGDPGPADEYPLPDLAAAEPMSPSPKASESAGTKNEEDKQSAAVPAHDDDSDSALWITLGVGAAALLGAAIAIPVVRARRRNTTSIAH
ncbi:MULTISPECIES: type VII secretion-associated serine protease mycosin [unclassified Streptomyces]|uniref:type VII secretion-associated serine protease mycosin n=1 Tax=unclassified Streptomyces TaxID=2593676 RepID=UPI002365AC03|nr:MULTISPECIES: type VII secretion-associated serine protease mycosin [unclassified Streptomyces]MDF3141215.1 type VII secretion-associated serine protease mycosin [Streptomyces sp. T21Q-yed]WDF40911.1 type VII secretion-associated serine protease mycosin [Streptomyces sp. T12]